MQEFLHSRPAKLTLSLLLLTCSVFLMADFFELRGNQRQELKEARKMLVESMAVQLSLFASESNMIGIEHSLLNFVSRNPEILAATLVTAEEVMFAEYGQIEELSKVKKNSTLSHLNVPILQGKRLWGSVKVVFKAPDILIREISYFGFVLLSCALLYLLFLRKALLQLDPGKVVPDRVNSAFNMFSEGVVILDGKLRILLANESVADTLGKPVDALLGKSLDNWPWQKSDNWQAPWSLTLQSGLKVADEPLHLQTSDGTTRIFMVSCSVVGNELDGKRGVLVTLDDMTAIEHKNRELALTLRELRRSQDSITQKNRELEALATQDPLTGLANRRSLMSNFEREFAKAKRESSALSCIMTDIDHFKNINDTFGHSVGDEVICAVANTLLAECREYDTVGRYGGEEYVIVLPGLSVSEAAEVAERIRISISILVNDSAMPVNKLTSSFGVAEVDEDVRDGKHLLELADEALYASKRSGRNRVLCYGPSLESQAELHAEDDENSNALGAVQTRVLELETIVDQRTRDLELLREYDSLTGIPLRSLFIQRIDIELQRSERKNSIVGVLCLEIKDLNRIISTFGQSASEQLVIDFVTRLHDSLRRTDVVSTVSEEHNMSRITSTEYGVILTDLDESGQSMLVITRLRRLLSKPFQIGDQKVYVGASIGVSLYPQNGKNAVELMESAIQVRNEAALSPDKFSHRFASNTLDKKSREHIELETDLYEAYERSEFEVYFQPKLDLLTRQISGLEALLRWRHPEKGHIPPYRFIPVAEANGLIHDLSNFVLTKSLEQISAWNSTGWPELRVSINISPLQLRDSDLVPEILDALHTFNIPGHQLEIELTETSVIDSPQRARIVLNQLRKAGVHISMDDFGTGYTSLALLADLPLDSVKIDRSFITAMAECPRSRAIVESVINMSHALSLHVVGEGIETNEQLAMLAGLGCNVVQGYLISHPLPANEITQFLEQHFDQQDAA